MKTKKLIRFAIAALCLLGHSSTAFAADALNSGNTAWMIVATALVMVMTPAGLALFYGGMSRYKNLLNTYAMTFVAYCLGSVIWMMWGYTIAFGPDKAGIIGGLDNLFLNGIGVNSLSGTIPTYVFVVFQMTFAAITVALVLGSIVDRLKFSSWIVFTVLWLTVVYSPIAHWVWGSGWMAKMGALDFAGGTVVHINAGVAGLILSLILGKTDRLRQGSHVSVQHIPDRPGRGAAVVRVVRLQRRQPVGRRRIGRFSFPGHQYFRSHGRPGMDVYRMVGE